LARAAPQHSLTTAVWGRQPVTGAWTPSTARTQADILNVDYINLDREFKMLPAGKLTPDVLHNWNEALSKWSAFYTDLQGYLSVTPLNVDSKISQITMFRGVLVGWRDQFTTLTGKAPTSPAPVVPPVDNKKEDSSIFDSIAQWWSDIHIPWWVTAGATLGVVYVGYSVYKTAGVVKKDTARLKEGAMRGAERAVEHHIAGPSALATTDLPSATETK
jgi:hypothetical protein